MNDRYRLQILYEHYADATRNKLRELLAKRAKKRCACCKKPTKRFVLDHCHETGIIRGAICHRCNNGLGMLGDNTEGVLMAWDYLQAPVSQEFLNAHPPYNWNGIDDEQLNFGRSPRNHQRDRDIVERKNLPVRHQQRRKKKPKEVAVEPSLPSGPPKLFVVR